MPGPDELAPAATKQPELGFFEAQILIADPNSQAPDQSHSPRTVLLLFDNSLSMPWEKLERSYAALEAVLRSLRPADHFNLLLFNQAVTPFQPQLVPADPPAIQQALSFVRASKLRGDANLALLRALFRNGGFLEAVTSTEPVDPHLQSFLSKLTHNPSQA